MIGNSCFKKRYVPKAPKRTLLIKGLLVFSLLGWGKLGSAQNTTAEILTHAFDNYRVNDFQEKIYVQTDKNFYLAGEICWFKLYTVDAFFNRPVSLSKLAYVEILDAANKPVLQAKIAIREGEGDGDGSFQLPVNLASGNYRLRAYSNWMKNFNPAFFFEKNITIVNARIQNEIDTTAGRFQYDLQLFPEGGNLLAGIESKIAFKINNQFGKGMEGKGCILDEKNDTLLHFEPLNFGMGSFLFTPLPGHAYKAMLTLLDGEIITRNLPMVYNTGFAMRLDTLAGNRLRITVHAIPAANNASRVTLFVHTRESVKTVLGAVLQNGTTEWLLDQAKLGDGISQITLFNSEREPVCERLYFKYPEKKLLFNLALQEDKFDTRKKIDLTIHATDQNGKAAIANLSVAIIRTDSLQASQDLDINSYLWLSADLIGKIESPSYYFNAPNAHTLEAMDNLMLTQGWRRFNWDNVLQQNRPAFEFVPEYRGHTIYGKIINTASGQPGRDIYGYLSVPSTRTIFKTGISDENGNIKFTLKDFYNEGEVIVQTNAQQDSLYRVEITSPFSTKYPALPLEPLRLPASTINALTNLHQAVQVENYYHAAKQRWWKIPNIDTTAFYSKPDVSYLLDNFVRFTTMEEVLREYVTPVNVRKRGGKFHLPTFDELRRTFFDGDPMVLLDGVPIFDFNKLMNYDPLKVRKLDVISRTYYIGNTLVEGLSNFVTYKGNLDGFELDPHATVLDYEGLQQEREFYAPRYETADQVNSRLPDFRNVLYWAPVIKTNQNGMQAINFFSSDLPGKYTILAEGICADGTTAAKTISFTVHAPAQN